MTTTRTTTATACPECGGPSEPGHPAGVLGGWHHTNACELHAAEDSTRNADATEWQRWPRRPATVAEVTLLAAVLRHAVPTGLVTELTQLTPSMIRRTWPTIGVE